MRVLLIMNPKAGRRRSSPLGQITDLLQSEPQLTLSLHETTGPGDATVAARKAIDDGFDVVLAAGGDGSVNEVANGLVGSEVALGIIPVGTENVLAREMGIPLDPRQACRFMLDRESRKIDTGKIGDRHFVCFAGIGFDAHVAHNLPAKRKKALGALAYFVTSLEKIGPYRKEARTVRLKVDDETLEMSYWMMLVGNIRTYGGGMTPAPRASLEDGLLDLCIFPKASYSQTLQQMVSTRGGTHLRLPGVKYFQARRIEIETDPVEQVQLDGDPWTGTTPLVVEVQPKSLWARF